MELSLRLLGCVGVVVLWVALSGWICMLLWNWVIVALFHTTPIDYPLGIGISLVLSVIGSAFRSHSK